MKRIPIIAAVLMLLAASGVVQAAPPTLVPAYYVLSEDPDLMALLGAKHRFPGAFSAELSHTQLGMLKRIGVETRPVEIYQITGKPSCNHNGICEPERGENASCQDCKSEESAPSPSERTCYPSAQLPWGVVKVNGGSGGAGIAVAVLDTGVDQDHPDLADNILQCVTRATHFKPDARTCEDGHGHGTHVSGIVLANGGGDGQGIYGVAPEASLVAVKVCDRRGYCYGDDMAAGIRYAADNDVEIISMSIGGDSPDYQVLEAIDYAVAQGVLVVAAAGNDGPSIGSIDWPGAYHEVIAVGATDVSDAVPDWSSRGINDGDYVMEDGEVEFGAPGAIIESAYNDGCYALMSGTSMATPHASGLAAKLWQGDGAATRTHLRGISRDIHDSGDDPATGYGLPVAPGAP